MKIIKYKLIENSSDNNINPNVNIIETILHNRGIDDCKRYLNLDEEDTYSYTLLDNIDVAVQLFLRHFNELRSPISILVDSDPDGYCSASMMYSYIKRMDRDYPVQYILHNVPKAHGLSNDYVIPEDTKLLIIPDAGTNDTQECKRLVESGINVLILDHHEKERDNEYAVIVNNQMSANYPNKQFCGAGVVYKFLQALDNEIWNDFANDFLDLCALANISDVMDMRSFETRYLVGLGLRNIKNKCFQALIKSQDFSMSGKINIHNIQWSITTILNGLIRVGTYEEKELLFKAFIEQDEYFEYKKRATKDHPAETIEESIYDRAARLCKNAKSRQDKMREKSVSEISNIVKDTFTEDDKVIVEDVTGIVDRGLTGVVAIKIADKFKRPCILLQRHMDSETNLITYGGSARIFNHSPIDSFKDIVNRTHLAQGLGHASAFGIVGLGVNNLELMKETINDLLEDVEFTTTYDVDFEKDIYKVDVPLVLEMSKLENYIGQGIDEPLIVITNIELNRNDISVFGKNEDTLSFNLNGIKYVQFKCKNGNGLYDFVQDAWDENSRIKLEIVGKPSVNEYGGVKTPQILIEDLNVLEVSISDDTNEDFEW